MAHLKTLMTDILSHDKPEDSALRSNLQDEIINRYKLFDVFKEVLQLDKVERVKHLAVCSVLCAKCPINWFEDSVKDVLGKKDFSVVKDILESGYVPVILNKEHYLFDKDDFNGVDSMALTIMTIFNVMLEKFKDHFDADIVLRPFISHICPELLQLILEHVDENVWTSELSMVVARYLLSLVKQLYKSESDSELLMSTCDLAKTESLKTPETCILYQLLVHIIPKLTKDKWSKYPGVKSVFQWCLFHTTYPHLYEHIEKFLPPSLNFTDDYILDNKIAGVKCLEHIMKNVSPEEMRWFSRAEVIYDSLKQQLYTNDAGLNEVSYPAILTALKIVEKLPESAGHVGERKSIKHDEIFHMLLQNAACENKIVLRQIITKHLTDFVEEMGILAVKHIGRILQIVEDYLQSCDGPEEISRLNVLNLLEKLMKNCWPRIPHYTECIFKILLKFLCSISIQDSGRAESVTFNLVNRVTTCLKLLKLIGGSKCEILLNSVDCPELPPLCVKVLKDVQFSVDCTG